MKAILVQQPLKYVIPEGFRSLDSQGKWSLLRTSLLKLKNNKKADLRYSQTTWKECRINGDPTPFFKVVTTFCAFKHLDIFHGDILGSADLIITKL